MDIHQQIPVCRILPELLDELLRRRLVLQPEKTLNINAFPIQPLDVRFLHQPSLQGTVRHVVNRNHLAGSGDQEADIGHVPAEQAAWVAADPPKPFQVDPPHPARSALLLSGNKIQGGPHPDSHRHTPSIDMHADEFFLLRRSQGHKQNICTGLLQPFQDFPVIHLQQWNKGRREGSRYLQTGMPLPENFHGALGNTRRPSKPIDPETFASRAPGQHGGQIRSGHPSLEAGSEERRQFDDWKTVCQHQIRVDEDALQFGIAPGAGDKIQIRGGNTRRPAATDPLNDPVDGLIKCDVMKRDAIDDKGDRCCAIHFHDGHPTPETPGFQVITKHSNLKKRGALTPVKGRRER